ncbi:unnamed protein product [Paramecium octaurelia]|uniref:Uncharacterized protein n=1 Tax=Paramecium octaurelia TaxID=43137 RepID=A0A8S1YL14_PAROT|nr:unnamed protein product [Paramecium octaurelia]
MKRQKWEHTNIKKKLGKSIRKGSFIINSKSSELRILTPITQEMDQSQGQKSKKYRKFQPIQIKSSISIGLENIYKIIRKSVIGMLNGKVKLSKVLAKSIQKKGIKKAN